ncbi:hypothetical protein [Antarctobacter heliothermus]|nr:hypothetical protein [Antarctobacter heliothermus]
MKRSLWRTAAPRPACTVLARPRPTAASALLLAFLLSLPFGAVALLQALF